MGIPKLTTIAYQPSGNGGVERVNHTMAQMLAMVSNEHQNDWDAHLPHVEYAYHNSVSAATGLAPNEVHIERLPRLPPTAFNRSYGGGHQSLDRDHLVYCDLARERQQHAYELVREPHALTVARVTGRNSTLSDALLRRPNMWAVVGYGYTTAATIRQELHKGVDNKVLKENYPSTGQDPSKSLLLVPLQQLHNPTDAHSETSCYTLTSRQTCPALLLNPALQGYDADIAPTLTMWTTCPDTFLPASHSTFYTHSPPNHPHTTSLRTTLQLHRS